MKNALYARGMRQKKIKYNEMKLNEKKETNKHVTQSVGIIKSIKKSKEFWAQKCGKWKKIKKSQKNFCVEKHLFVKKSLNIYRQP